MSISVKKGLQDKLFIEMLDLVEQSVLSKTNIETATNAGQLLLAKSRYIQGPQSVSLSKLPTENSADFNALKTLTKVDSGINERHEFELHKQEIDKDNGFVDPIRWFGVLVPRSLQMAQQHFNLAVEIIVECANIQLKLSKTIENILMLRNE